MKRSRSRKALRPISCPHSKLKPLILNGMRAYQIIHLLLTAAGCLAGHLGWAQRAAVAPLAPLLPVARPMPSKGILDGRQSGMQPPRQSAGPATTAPAACPALSEPIYLLNSHIIINGNGLNGINPQDIADLHVYKGADAPVQWRSLTEHGIINITLKPGVRHKLKTKSLTVIRRQTKATGLVSFKLNGLRLDDPSLRIATAAIAGLDVLRNESETVINIRLAPFKPLPRHDPPGTIYIRGVASR
jgi:hypothetical protein